MAIKRLLECLKWVLLMELNRVLDTRKKATLIGQINDPNSKIAKILKNVLADDEYGESLLKSLKLADQTNQLAKNINPKLAHKQHY